MTALLCLFSFVYVAAGWSPQPPVQQRSALLRSSRSFRAAPVRAAADDEGAPEPAADELLQALDSQQLEAFNNELYAHLSKRPEYETSELYSSLRKRVDVDDPLYSELKERREIMMSDSPMPSPTQTPGEVIELVLRALRDVDWPNPGHGIGVLQNYSSAASILGDDRPGVTTDMLLEYFASSKYSILLEWVSIQYLRKLEVSLDKKRALQQIRLTSAAGESVPVTFQLSKQTNAAGVEVWLIDQLLVKT